MVTGFDWKNRTTNLRSNIQQKLIPTCIQQAKQGEHKPVCQKVTQHGMGGRG